MHTWYILALTVHLTHFNTSGPVLSFRSSERSVKIVKLNNSLEQGPSRNTNMLFAQPAK